MNKDRMNIKTMIGILLLVILVLAGILIVKTFTYPFLKTEKQQNYSAVTVPLVSNEALERFAGGIRIPTVSTEVYENTNFEPFDRFKAYLPEAYPAIYEAMDTLTINNYGLVFHWKGKDGSKKPILFLSHYDVVPVIGYEDDNQEHLPVEIVFQPEDEAAPSSDAVHTSWDYPPFSGAVARGNIYGRGTLDMKCMLFSVLEAANALLAEGFQPEQDIWFAFGHDEEVGGKQGAVKIAAYFKEQNMSFDAIYDEGGIIAAPGSALETIDRPIALVGQGEKGFLTLRLTVHGLGGHSSMPPKKSSLVYAAEIIEKLNSNQMPARIIPPIASFFTNIGGEMGFMSRMAIANQWLLKPLLVKSLSNSPASNALIRSTTAISMAKGSDAANVLTSVAEVTVNFRILPGSSVADVIEHVENLCEGYKVDIAVISEREPSALSPEDVRAFQVIRETVGQIYPEAIVSPYITIGGTDAYKYQMVSDHIYRFMPLYLNQYEQRTIHNENEHISIDNYGKLIWYFKEIMQTY